MKHDDHKNDISIGDNAWIKFIDLTGRYDSAVDVDEIISGVSELWDALELECVAECCGLHAFTFHPEAIKDVVATMDKERIESALVVALSEIEKLPTSVVVSKRLNNYEDKRVFIELLTHISKVVMASRSS